MDGRRGRELIRERAGPKIGLSILLTLLLAVAPTALAQESDPTVNDSDFNTTPPESDESYLEEAEAESTEEPTLTDADFDTSVPATDESYLDDGVAASDGGASARDTPAPAAVLALVGLAAAALVLRRRA